MNYYNYFTEIEEHFVRRRGKNLLVSPMDWSLIATWRDAGVPLHVALRGIDLAMDSFTAKPHRGRGKVNTLFYCHESVMEEYARYLDAHLGEETGGGGTENQGPSSPGDSGQPDPASVREFLDRRISEIKAARAKLHSSEEGEAGMDRIMLRLEEIAGDLGADAGIDFESLERDLGILDEDLTAELQKEVPDEAMEDWRKEARAALKVYRRRLPAETYGKIVANFMRDKIRQRFGIGELSLFHL